MSPNLVSAVLEKLICCLCLRDFPCRYTTKVRLWDTIISYVFVCQMGDVCQVFVERWPASLCTLRANDRSHKTEREDGIGGAEVEETNAFLDEMSSLSVASGSLMEPSSCIPETGGCAGSSTPPRQLCLRLLYHPSYFRKRCELFSIYCLGGSSVMWNNWEH